MKKLLKCSIFVFVFAAFFASPRFAFAQSAQTDFYEDTPVTRPPTAAANPFLDYFDDPRGADSHFRAHRVFDLGLASSLSAGLANNLLGVADIMRETIVLDFNEMTASMDSEGWKIGMFFDVNPVSIALNPTLERRSGGGLTVKTHGDLQLVIPKSLFQLISEGNAGSEVNTGDVSVSAAVYAAADIDFHIPIELGDKKLQIGLTPSYYIPLVYIPGGKANYRLETNDDGSLKVTFQGSFDVYSIVDITNYTAIGANLLSAGAGNLGGGVDLALYAEYPVLARLDLGFNVSGIPLFPAQMDSGVSGTLATNNGEPVFYAESALKAGDAEINMPAFHFENYRSLTKITVTRPLKGDFYMLFRPLSGGALILRPNIGYTFATAASEASFNFGFELSTNPHWLFQMHLFTGHEDGYWKNEAGLNFNFRVFEIIFAAALRSQSFLGSWEGDGASVTIGLHWGF